MFIIILKWTVILGIFRGRFHSRETSLLSIWYLEVGIFFFLAIFSDYVLVSNSFLPLMVVEGSDPVRRETLIELLDIDLQWRMHKVSDGQRRRVQICMGLLHPFKVWIQWDCIRMYMLLGFAQIWDNEACYMPEEANSLWELS